MTIAGKSKDRCGVKNKLTGLRCILYKRHKGAHDDGTPMDELPTIPAPPRPLQLWKLYRADADGNVIKVIGVVKARHEADAYDKAMRQFAPPPIRDQSEDADFYTVSENMEDNPLTISYSRRHAGESRGNESRGNEVTVSNPPVQGSIFEGTVLPNGGVVIMVQYLRLGVVVLSSYQGQFVTWRVDPRTHEAFWGHYFGDDRNAATRDFWERVGGNATGVPRHVRRNPTLAVLGNPPVERIGGRVVANNPHQPGDLPVWEGRPWRDLYVGDRVVFNQYAGMGRAGAEWREATGTVRIVNRDSVVVTVGSSRRASGMPTVVNEDNFLRAAKGGRHMKRNPPGDRIAKKVLAIEYLHEGDGKAYRHDFEEDTDHGDVTADVHDDGKKVVLRAQDGASIVQDFK